MRKQNKSERAAARLGRAGPAAATGHFLKDRSVSALTLSHYQQWHQRLRDFHGRQLPTSLEELDRVVAAFMDHLFFLGESQWTGRMALYGTAFVLDLSFAQPACMVRAKRALRGWDKASPEFSRDPLPWVALGAICSWLAQHRGQVGLQAARALALQGDAYFRPSELLAIQRQHVTVPHPRLGSKFKTYSIVVAPSLRDPQLASYVEVKAAKSGHFDDTVIIGDEASLRAHRQWLMPLMQRLVRNAPKPADFLFPLLTLPALERLFADAVSALGLVGLRATPHCVRHLGPSEDCLAGTRTLQQVQARGRWQAAASVARYSKQARLLRQVALVPEAALAAGTAALNCMASVLQV